MKEGRRDNLRPQYMIALQSGLPRSLRLPVAHGSSALGHDGGEEAVCQPLGPVLGKPDDSREE